MANGLGYARADADLKAVSADFAGALRLPNIGSGC
jgi:hypothetical protein